MGLQYLTSKDHQIEYAYKVSGRAVGSHGLGTTDSTCLLGIRRWLQDLTDSKHQLGRAYEVSERCCMTSRAQNIRAYMTTRYQDRAAGSNGSANQIRMVLQDLTDKKQQFKHVYEVSKRGCMGKEHQILHAYEVSGWGCRISRVGNYRSYMRTRHQEGTSGSHGFETPDRTCLLGVRTVLHDLTGLEYKIVHAYNVSGRRCRISRVGIYNRTCLLGIRRGLRDLTGSKHQIERAY